jgi:ketosteroid isomerase-like protein
MTSLSEDPTYLAGGLLLLAGVFLVALNITQQGKYLVRAGIMLGLALLIVAVEWFWVTDNERIEQVVYALRQAVLKSDAEGVLSQMAPNVQFLQADTALSEDATRAMIKSTLGRAEFDFVRISDLQTSVGQQSRRGQAEFRVFTRGRLQSSPGMAEPATAVTTWSLGFQETEPGVWKVSRISPVLIPTGVLAPPSGGRAMRDASSSGFGEKMNGWRARTRENHPGPGDRRR